MPKDFEMLRANSQTDGFSNIQRGKQATQALGCYPLINGPQKHNTKQCPESQSLSRQAKPRGISSLEVI